MKKIVKQRIESIFLKLEKDPTLIKVAEQTLNLFIETKYLSPIYIKKWKKILTLPIPQIKKIMLSENEEGEILRSTSILHSIK